LEDNVLLQTGVAYVSTERIHSLYRVILLGMDNIELRARRGITLGLWRRIACWSSLLLNFIVLDMEFCGIRKETYWL